MTNQNPQKPFSNLFPAKLLSTCRTTFNQPLSPIILSIAETAQLLQKQENSLPKFLTSTELQQLFSYSHMVRKNEFLCGRISAKLALDSFFTRDSTQKAPLNQISISNNSSGRPFVQFSPEYNIKFTGDLSISHSKQYGCALVSPKRCGIDIQTPTKTLQKVKAKYCADQEENILAAFLPDYSPVEQLCLLWTAKEAIKKALSHLRMIGFQTIVLTDCALHTNATFLFTFTILDHDMPRTVNTISTLFNGYGLSLTTTEHGG